MMKSRLSLLVLVAACGLVLLPTAGLAGQTRGQTLQKLIQFTGKGTKNSQPFRIKSTSVRVAYSYTGCPNGSDSFIVDLVGRGFNHIVVSVYGSHGRKRVLAYPRPGKYHLTVNTRCSWTVAVYGH